MKWIFLGVWLSSILFFHFRSKVRLPFGRQLLDHSIFLAPLNAERSNRSFGRILMAAANSPDFCC